MRDNPPLLDCYKFHLNRLFSIFIIFEKVKTISTNKKNIPSDKAILIKISKQFSKTIIFCKIGLFSAMAMISSSVVLRNNSFWLLRQSTRLLTPVGRSWNQGIIFYRCFSMIFILKKKIQKNKKKVKKKLQDSKNSKLQVDFIYSTRTRFRNWDIFQKLTLKSYYHKNLDFEIKF